MKGIDMSSSCKIVKGTSLFMLVLGIAAVAMGVFMAVSAPAAAGAPVENPVMTAQALGVALAVMGVVYFAAGVMGAIGANNPAKLGGFIVLGAVLAVVNAVEAVLCVVSGSPAYQNIIYAVFVAVAVYYASRAKKEARF